MGAIRAQAILFDLDGTLLVSKAVIRANWRRFAADHGIDEGYVLSQAKGRAARETIAMIAPELDADEEARRLERREATIVEGLQRIAGAAGVLRRIPRDRWALVTSSSRATAMHRLWFARLPIPTVLVCAGESPRGKPAPDPYHRAARLLGKDPAACIVIEDSPVGVEAGVASGATVFAVETMHAADRLRAAHRVVPCVSTLHVQTYGPPHREEGLWLHYRD